MKRWLGLAELLEDGIDHGTIAVEQVHQATARIVFDVLERVPPLAPPARLARSLQQEAISRTYRTIRLVNGVVGALVGTALAAAESDPPAD
jgi:uncharacterized membrane protein